MFSVKSFAIQCVLCTAGDSTVCPKHLHRFLKLLSQTVLDSNEPPFTGHRGPQCADNDLEVQDWLQIVVRWRLSSTRGSAAPGKCWDLYGLCLPQSFWFGACLTLVLHISNILRSWVFPKYWIISAQQFGVCHQKLWMSCRQQNKTFNSKGQMNYWGRNSAIYKLFQQPKKLSFVPRRMISKCVTIFKPITAWFHSLPSCLNKLFLILVAMHTKCTFLSATPFPAFSEMISFP